MSLSKTSPYGCLKNIGNVNTHNLQVAFKIGHAVLVFHEHAIDIEETLITEMSINFFSYCSFLGGKDSSVIHERQQGCG